MNSADIITRARRLFPDKPALVFGARTYSYRALDEAVDGVVAQLAGLGIAPGDRVALLLPNHPHLVLGWFAIQRLRCRRRAAGVLRRRRNSATPSSPMPARGCC
jgi:long-chain acyl-CoA synthetase